jgi:hypothetical protein
MYSGSPLRSCAFASAGEPPAKYPASPWRAGVACVGGFARLPVSGVDSPGPLAGGRRQNLLEQPARFVFLIVCHGYSFPALPRLDARLPPTSSQKLGVLAALVSSPRRLSAAFEEVPYSDWLALMGSADAPSAAWL